MSMKIAVPVKEKSMNSIPDDRFARAKYFLIYDPETGSEEYIEPDNSVAHGAGPMAVNMLTKKGISALIAFHLGGNAVQAIEAAGIAFYEAFVGTAKENIDAVLRKKK
ncbi:Dinitrogenase iron-molybdenum cofactor biosynthesis protein [Mesotoga infera]|nr:Dinitrogenase iron-molybdenum cofactor biosynthesis protein [Mesotoga infera]